MYLYDKPTHEYVAIGAVSFHFYPKEAELKYCFETAPRRIS